MFYYDNKGRKIKNHMEKKEMTRATSILKCTSSLTFLVLIAMFATGFSSLLYEVVLLFNMSIVLGMTELATSVVIGTFIVGLAIGSWFGGRISSIANATTSFIIIEIIIALFGFTSMFAVSHLINVGLPFLRLIFSVLLLLLPTILMGMEIPLAVHIINKHQKNVGIDTGKVYSADTLGGAFGAFLAGLILVPVLGFFGAMALGGILNLFAALLLLSTTGNPDSRKLFLISTLLFLCAGIFILFSSTARLHDVQLGFFFRDYGVPPLETAITPYQRIEVVARGPYGNSLVLNGELQITSHDSVAYHEYLVLPALAVIPNVESALVIGAGDGGALRQLLKYNVTTIDHVELDPEVINLSRMYMRDVHRGALDDPHVQRIIADGRRYLEDTNKTYDLIIVDLPDPIQIALAPLYSAEFYALIHKRLTSTGVFATQATSPLYYAESFASIYKTVHTVFPITESYIVPSSSFSSLGYVIASETTNLTVPLRNISGEWYESTSHASLFSIPKKIRNVLNDEHIGISTDNEPFVYTYHQSGYYARGILDDQQ